MEYREECLQALVAFFLENHPYQRQLSERTEKILNWRLLDYYEEVSGNLADISGLKARSYVDYVNDAFFAPGFHAYETLARLSPNRLTPFMGIDGGALRERFGIPAYHPEQLRTEEYLDHNKRNPLENTLKNSEYWKEQMDQAASFAEDCYRNGKEANLLNRNPDGLAEILERDREGIFLESIHHRISGTVPQEINKVRLLSRQIRLAALNLKSEIDHNFHTRISGITRPYLQRLYNMFCKQLKLVRKMPIPFCDFSPGVHQGKFCGAPGWMELQELLQRIHTLRINALEDICGLLEERLEMQQLAMEALERTNPSDKPVEMDYLLMEDTMYRQVLGGKETGETLELGLHPHMSVRELNRNRGQMAASLQWAAENREVHPVTGKKWSRNVYGSYFSFFNARTCDMQILASYNQLGVLPK